MTNNTTTTVCQTCKLPIWKATEHDCPGPGRWWSDKELQNAFRAIELACRAGHAPEELSRPVFRVIKGGRC
jgi:hypothetical protein